MVTTLPSGYLAERAVYGMFELAETDGASHRAAGGVGGGPPESHSCRCRRGEQYGLFLTAARTTT